MALTQMIRCL